MRLGRGGFWVVMALVAGFGVAFAADSPEEAAAALVEGIRFASGIPGMSAAVAIDGEIVWSQGFGSANLEQDVAATGQTKYRVGSISKMLTTGGVAVLLENGKLDLDAPVQIYVPSFPVKPEGVITTRLLTAHLSGISHYRPLDPPDWRRPHYDDVVASLKEFQDHALVHAPGTKYQYSSYAWNLVSAVVQGAAGTPFLEFMLASVFEPIGMRDTLADDPRIIVSNRTEFYSRGANEETVNARELDVSYKWAGGGFLSTVEDLVRYGSAWLPGTEFLKPETLEIMLTNQKTAAGVEVETGIGWRVGKDAEGRRIIHHGGHLTGGHGHLLVHLDEGLVVAMLCNTDYRAQFDLDDTEKLAHLFLPAIVGSE